MTTYKFMYDQTYNGNRAPVLIANHFNNWNGDSFNPPAHAVHAGLLRQARHLLRDLSGRHRLDGSCRTPTVLQDLLDQPPVAAAPPG